MEDFLLLFRLHFVPCVHRAFGDIIYLAVIVVRVHAAVVAFFGEMYILQFTMI